MSAADHTVGLAHIAENTGPCVIAVGDREICECYADGEEQTPEDAANARRIVACWNACSQISTAELETIPNTGGMLGPRTDIAMIAKESARLRELLNEAAGECGANKALLHRIRQVLA